MGVVSIDDSEAGHAVGCGHCGSIIVVPQSRLSPGAIVDDFVIEKEVGQGGLATVYLAHQMSLDRPAALKVLREQYASNRSFLEDFAKEARSAAQINHPNIVQAYAFGEEDDIRYFAMEFIQGETLKHILAHSGRLFPEKALEIIRVIAEALDYAWQKKRLVHLDIKPDNIILTEGNEYKLADLGLARLGGDIRDQTETSDVFGTPQYISPEVLTGSPTDNRTDIYSLGATLYHAVTGKHPFEGKTVSEIARKHITEPLVPACEVSKDIPKDLSDLIDIMMAKRPGHRWQSAAEVVEEIDKIGANKPISRHPHSEFQKPLNLEKIEEEFKASLDEFDDAQSVGKTSEKSARLKASATKLRKKGGAGVTLRTKKKGAGGQAAAGISRKKGTGGLTIKSSARKTTIKTEAASSKTGSAAASQSTDGKPSVPKRTRKKKKASPGAILGCLVAGLIFMLVAGGVGIFLVKNVMEQKAFEVKVASMGLSMPQYDDLQQFKGKIAVGVDDTTVLAEADTLLNRYADSNAMTSYVRDAAAPYVERELQNLRKEQHDQEILRWRDRSRELQEKARLEAQEAERQRLEAEKARAERERQERLQRQLEARIQALREAKPQARNQAIAQCQTLNFGVAKSAFIRFVVAPDDELSQWGKNWQQVIDLAEEALELVRNGEEFLKGERLAVKGRVQGFTITGVQQSGLTAQYREKIYNRGVYTGRENDKVENITVNYLDMRTDQLAKLMETSGRGQNMPEADIQLRVGAYFYVTGASPEDLQKHLKAAGSSQLVEFMLQDL